MIIWSGYGFVVFVVVFLDSLVAEVVSESLTHDENYYQNNLIPLGCSFLVSAIVVRLISDFMIRRKRQSVTAGEKNMVIGKEHRLFFIPLFYWPLILMVLGSGIVIYQLVR
ncbi:hypothetical protein [Ferruginibacter profundus]